MTRPALRYTCLTVLALCATNAAWAKIPPPTPETFYGNLSLNDPSITLTSATLFSEVQTVLYSIQMDAIPLTLTPVAGGYKFTNTNPFSLPGVALTDMQGVVFAAHYSDASGDHLAISLADSVSPTLSFDQQFPLAGGETQFLADLASGGLHDSAKNFMTNYGSQLVQLGQGHTDATLYGFSGPTNLGSSTVSLAPEPASLVLAAIGGLGLIACARRRRGKPSGILASQP